MKLFTHFVSEKYLSLKEEQKAVKDYYVNKSKGIKDYDVNIESVKFEIFNKKTEYTFIQFWEDVKKILKHQAVKRLEIAIKSFFEGKLNPTQLFAKFKENFGNQLSYKYYYRYAMTLQG